MIDFLKVFKTTNAYKILEGDKKNDKLSHAYLFLCSDNRFLKEYLTIISKIIMCDDGFPCLTCRNCELIKGNAHSDVVYFPKGEKGVLTEDITNLIEDSYIKPIESDKKLFVVANAETMNLSAQNKLLKTLEEPPKNVHILLGAITETPLLQTIKSRVKKIEFNALDDEIIFNSLTTECQNTEKLKEAIACGDGTIGKALSLYGDEKFENALALVKDLLTNMKTSRDVLLFSTKIEQSKVDLLEFINVLEVIFADFLYMVSGQKQLVKNSVSLEIYDSNNGLKKGAIITILEKINEAKKRKKFNANEKMLLEWLLFQILEGKHKWQKL